MCESFICNKKKDEKVMNNLKLYFSSVPNRKEISSFFLLQKLIQKLEPFEFFAVNHFRNILIYDYKLFISKIFLNLQKKVFLSVLN